MKYIPKSMPGAIIAVLYLLLTGYLISVFAFGGGGGPHGEAGTAFIYSWVLTLPLSAVLTAILLEQRESQPNTTLDLLFIFGLAVCALINAGIVYLVIGFAASGLRALLKKPLE